MINFMHSLTGVLQIILFFAPQLTIIGIIIGWFISSRDFNKPAGPLNRGYKIHEKPLKPDHLKYLLGLQDGIQMGSTKSIYGYPSNCKPGFVIKKSGEILIYGGTTHWQRNKEPFTLWARDRDKPPYYNDFENVVIPTLIAYVDIKRPEPMLEFRIPVSVKSLRPILIVYFAFIFLSMFAGLFRIIFNIISILLFGVFCAIVFSVETDGIDKFLNGQIKAKT